MPIAALISIAFIPSVMAARPRAHVRASLEAAAAVSSRSTVAATGARFLSAVVGQAVPCR